jgi:hypothetical protein
VCTATNRTHSSKHKICYKSQKSCCKPSADFSSAPTVKRTTPRHRCRGSQIWVRNPSLSRDHGDAHAKKNTLMANFVNQRPQRSNSRRCPLGPSCRTKVCNIRHKGWRFVLMETGLGSWADEMEDMPIPCEWVRSKKPELVRHATRQAARILTGPLIRVHLN